jgi:hypothetical protein
MLWYLIVNACVVVNTEHLLAPYYKASYYYHVNTILSNAPPLKTYQENNSMFVINFAKILIVDVDLLPKLCFRIIKTVISLDRCNISRNLLCRPFAHFKAISILKCPRGFLYY